MSWGAIGTQQTEHTKSAVTSHGSACVVTNEAPVVVGQPLGKAMGELKHFLGNFQSDQFVFLCVLQAMNLC